MQNFAISISLHLSVSASLSNSVMCLAHVQCYLTLTIVTRQLPRHNVFSICRRSPALMLMKFYKRDSTN